VGASVHLAGASAPLSRPLRIEETVVPGRSCGTCTLCCKVAAVEEIAKPIGAWCPHCIRQKGCAIYQERPASCRTFYCQWMLAKGLGPEWKPERAKFALIKSAGGTHLTALVDPGFPSAWRRSPYYENLKHWAVEAAQKLPDLWLVDAMIGPRCIVILPDREVDIGILGADEMIRLEYTGTPGAMIEARKVKATLAPALAYLHGGAGCRPQVS
jgi:Fe-S-cluster containining protein